MARIVTSKDDIATRVAKLTEEVDTLGGLVSRAMMADRMNLSKQRVSQIAKHPTFPAPVCEVDGKSLWAWESVRQWRDQGGARYGWSQIGPNAE